MRMKRHLFIILAALLLITMTTQGQTYQQMWKQVDEAQQKDLPQTALKHVGAIRTKAQKAGDYGQLLKASLLFARLQTQIAPDSLQTAVQQLEQQARGADTEALKAVYATVLARVYSQNPQLGDDWEAKSQRFRQMAMANPDVLAQTKADTFLPFVIEGDDSEAYGDDLLSVVGSELDEWQWLKDYYGKAGNRRALCHLALRTADSLKELDSLMALYGDLPEASIIGKRRQRRWTVDSNPQFHVTIPQQVAVPGAPQMLKLQHLRNISSLTIQVYRTKLNGDTDLNPYDSKDYATIRKGMTELTSHHRTVTFGMHTELEVFEDSVLMDGLSPGVYLIECHSLPVLVPQRALLFVSGLRVMSQSMPGDMVRYVVVDARTGQPVPNAVLRLLYGNRRNSRTEEQACDMQGEAMVHVKGNRPSEVYAFTADDRFCLSVNNYGRYSYYERQYTAEHTNLFTDRSIYRPGQTVHVAAIVWKECSAVNNEAVAGRQLTLQLRDANYKVVAEQQVVTDKYGKCSSQFTLPTGLLNGHFTIRANGSSVGFSVEEYKRPTFQVEFDEYKKQYQQGDTVRAEAKAVSYAGVPVQGATVRYTVRRRVAFWWLTYSRYWQQGYAGDGLHEVLMSEGESRTDDEGNFSVEVPLNLPDEVQGSAMYYNFVVEADVTDQAGETHHGSLSLPLGTKPTALTCDLPQQVRRDQMPEVTFTRRNAAGQEIEGTVRYRLDDGKWHETPANAPCQVLLPQLKSGEHRLEALCQRDTIDVRFVVFSLDDKVPAAQTHDWFYVSDTQFPGDGTPVTLQVGSSDPDLHIVYGIYAGGKVVESGVIKENASLLNRRLTYKEEYGSGLLLTYAWVKDGQCYHHAQTITRPMPDKRLQLSWETFRDRLTPGQQEEWRLTVNNPDGTPADASLMAVLYDKSLDQIRQHQWDFSPNSYRTMASTTWQCRQWGSVGISGAKGYELIDIRDFEYSHFDTAVYPYYVYPVRIGGSRMYAMAAAPKAMMERKQTIGSFSVQGTDEAVTDAAENVVVGYGVNAKTANEASDSDEPRPEQVQLRENLQETAFCYPQLTTDEKGGVTLKFTLPESLTTWRMMGVANTPDMLFGSIEGEAVAKKTLMVQPNMPRFVREGDEAVITTRIINTSQQPLKGEAHLRLDDADSADQLLSLSQHFEVEAGKTLSLSFHIPSAVLKAGLLICKVSAMASTAENDGFSDGEQHYLPVMPNSEYVTKTVPITQHEPGTQDIDLTKLFPQGTTHRLFTVEYTDNPAWLMVQSLPTLGQPHEHSAIDHAASYYSNLLAKTLLAQTPQVKTVFEQWKRDNVTLHSQLSKNQELKDLVLSETPWVGAADRETEQRQRLADFFDENGISNRLSTAAQKLQKLQHADGSFSWFPGMEGSTYITMAVQEMLVRLNHIAGMQPETRQMQDRAFGFLGRQMLDIVQELKKQEKKGHKPQFPSFTALRWLYLCALDGRQLPADVRAANNYLIVLLKKDIKRQTIYEKALTAIVLARQGQHKVAREYVQSLKEYTVYTEEMGRYYDTGRAAYSWYDYKIPTEVAAIEAIQAVTPDDRQTVDEMRRWLLQEKRTQAWDTPISSVNAIWAFLYDHNSLLASRPQTTLAIDGEVLPTPGATAALGYVKTTITEPKGKTFTATKRSEESSWGAVYAQFLQKTSDIEASQSGIAVKREVMSQQPLHVGDRVKVRITIETSRDLDFVQVVDRRAACMEPVRQLSGYSRGVYVSPKDNATHYFYYGLAKGRHVIETEYYIDRPGQYATGSCSVQCAYAPEFRATAPSMLLNIKDNDE